MDANAKYCDTNGVRLGADVYRGSNLAIGVQRGHANERGFSPPIDKVVAEMVHWAGLALCACRQ